MIIKISDKLRDDKGVTLITLIIAITTFAVFITVFSYVMVAKHGSSALYVQSTQAYAIAQAGIEYGIRYATDNGYGSFPINEQPFGDGSFSLDYTDINDADRPNSLTSTGKIGVTEAVAEREIILEHFVGWVEGEAVTLVPEDQPEWKANTLEIPLIINYGENVYVFRIALAKLVSTVTPVLKDINFETTEVWSSADWVSFLDDNPIIFDFNSVSYYTAVSGPVMLVLGFQSASATAETWSCTFWYSKQVDLSNPQTSLVIFITPE